MARGLEKPPWWAVVVIVVGLVGTIVGLPYALNRGGEPLSKAELDRMAAANSAGASSDAATAPVRILVVGDSYTAGSAMGGNGENGWPSLVAAELGTAGFNVTFDVAACGGGGYTNAGTCGKDLRQVADAKNGSGYDLAVFFGSRNDDAAAGDVQDSAAAAFAGLRAENPNLRFVVIGPPWVNGDPPAWIQQDRNEVSAAAKTVQATFVDPLQDGWFAGEYGSLIGTDGVHPTDEGHRYMASLILPVMEAALKEPAPAG